MPPRPLAKHSNFRAILIHTAKCDRCDSHNRDTIYRCCDCGEQICTPCIKSPISDGQHVLNEASNITPAAPIARGSAKKKKRGREPEGLSLRQSRKASTGGLSASRSTVKSLKQVDKGNGKKKEPTPADDDWTESDSDVQIVPRPVSQPKVHGVLEDSDSDLEFVPRRTKKRQRVSPSNRRTAQGNVHHIKAGPYNVPISPAAVPRASSDFGSPEPKSMRHLSEESHFKRSDSPSPSDIEDPPIHPAGRPPRPSITRHGFLTPPAQSSSLSFAKDRFHCRSRSDCLPHPPTEDDIEAAGILTTLSRSSASRSPNASGTSDVQQQHEEQKVLKCPESQTIAARMTDSELELTEFEQSTSFGA